MKKECAIRLHTEFTPLHLVSAVLLVSITLFLAQVLQSTVLCSLRANSPQQIDILHVKLLVFRGAMLGPLCKYLSIASFSFRSREDLKMNEYIQTKYWKGK